MKSKKIWIRICGIIILVIVVVFLSRRGTTYSNFLVFTNTIGNYSLQIYIADADGKNKTRLTSDERTNYAAAISPNGQYLVFVSASTDQSKAPSADLYLIEIATMRFVQLTHLIPDASTRVDHPIWSPDGKHIAFLQTDTSKNKSMISVIDTNGTHLKTNAIDGTAEHLSWSPDNNQIVFNTYYSGKWVDYFGVKYAGYYTITLWDIQHDKTQMIVDGRDHIFAAYPEWSPKGQQIAYSALKADDSSTQIYVANADGSNPVRVTRPEDQPGYNKIDPIWSPDGSQILFRAAQNMGQGSKEDCLVILLANDSDCSIPIYIMNKDGTHLREIVSVGANVLPSWSPDGRQIVFMSLRQRKFSAQIYVVNVDGTDAHLVTDDLISPFIEYGPLWGKS